jgi:uncharacterized delta-60 repeat protein
MALSLRSLRSRFEFTVASPACRPPRQRKAWGGLRVERLEDRTLLSAGALDPTFGTGGKDITDFGGSGDYAGDVVLLPGGKILVGGGGNHDFALARYNSDGTLDTTFGTGGKVTTDFGIPDDNFRAFTAQPDGKILSVGSIDGPIGDTALARYNPDGSLDASFGTGGKVITDVTGRFEQAIGVALQSDGKIVIVGHVHEGGPGFQILLARFNSNGSLDTTFGSGGSVRRPTFPSQLQYSGNAIAVQPDDKLIVAASSSTGGATGDIGDFVVLGFTPNGGLHATFGTGGIVTTSFAVNSGVDHAYNLVLQPDGKIVVVGGGGSSWVLPGGVFYENLALARYNPNGTLDTAFGTGGKILTPFGVGGAVASDVALLASGQIVVAGSTGTTTTGPEIDFALALYTNNGVLEPSFGSGGKITTDFSSGQRDHGSDLVVQPDGKIVVVGSSVGNWALARYEGINTPPTANAGGPYTVAEGSSVPLTGSGSDSDPGDTLTYAWDLDNNGTFETPGQNVTFSVAGRDGPSSQTVVLRVTDNGGLSATSTATVSITNVPPTASLAGPSDGVRGQARTFTLAASDPSPVDQAAGFTFNVNWGDGSSQTVTGPSGTQVDHTYTATGTYTVQATATDKDGGVSGPVTHSIAITAVGLLADGTLAAGGTAAGDTIIFQPTDALGNITVTINGADQGTFHPTAGIAAFGQAGNDLLRLLSKKIKGTTVFITVPAVLSGGDGNDGLDASGSTANNILLGGTGNDGLAGGSGRDILIGGTGQDGIAGGGGDDLLIAGFTAFDANLTALNAIMAEWASPRDYATRIANLRGTGSGPRLNGDYFLKADGPDKTVFDDGVQDWLFGGAGQDWFFANADGGVLDTIFGLEPGELVDDLD